jgi:hypothetical protein
MKILAVALLLSFPALAQEELSAQLLTVKRVYVDKLTGGETAAQMRDLIIDSLEGSKLYVITENPDRADLVMHGAAEDLIFTDSFQSSEGINMRGGAANSGGSSTSSRFNGVGSGYESRSSRSVNLGVGDESSSNIKERRHEALATVRLVNKDGDVIWSTTQESSGAKFRGASADVAEKIARQLADDVARLKHPRAAAASQEE